MGVRLNMSRNNVVALAACLLVVSGTLVAQRGGGPRMGGGSRMGAGSYSGGGRSSNIQRQTVSAGASRYSYGRSITPLYSNQSSGYYGSSFSFGQSGYGGQSDFGAYAAAQLLGAGYGRPAFVMILAPFPADQIVYIPTYFRPDPGPSLGEIARAVRAHRLLEKAKLRVGQDLNLQEIR